MGSNKGSAFDCTASQTVSVGNWVEKQRSSPPRLQGTGQQRTKHGSNWDCLAGFNNRAALPTRTKKSSTIKVVKTNLLGRSQNDIVVSDVEADIVSGGGLGDQHVGFEESVATEPGIPQNLTADQMFALNLLKASDV